MLKGKLKLRGFFETSKDCKLFCGGLRVIFLGSEVLSLALTLLCKGVCFRIGCLGLKGNSCESHSKDCSGILEQIFVFACIPSISIPPVPPGSGVGG